MFAAMVAAYMNDTFMCATFLLVTFILIVYFGDSAQRTVQRDNKVN